ncbi:MAG: hypothetical protein JSV33_00470 [bacterium]|nr:MAG: hypothetical protein JSV33_00470 [bacterium]
MRNREIVRLIRKIFTLCILPTSLILLLGTSAHGEASRRIGAAFHMNYYTFDPDYFGIENALGAEIDLRYELLWNIYFENRIGAFHSLSGGTSVGGLSYQLGLVAIFPVLIPYRPIARFGFGFLSSDPVTVTPTESFRPSQTAFYIVVGGGITRSIKENIVVEFNANLWATPYRYRIYRFNRSSVEAENKQFTHFGTSLGILYIF